MWMLLKYWKVAVVALVVLASAAGGYRLASLKYKAEAAKVLQETVKYYEDALVKNREINKDLNEAISKIQDNERVVYQEVIKYVEANPNLAECELDSNGLQLWNSASPADLP